jgi:hypothetical protein
MYKVHLRMQAHFQIVPIQNGGIQEQLVQAQPIGLIKDRIALRIQVQEEDVANTICYRSIVQQQGHISAQKVYFSGRL